MRFLGKLIPPIMTNAERDAVTSTQQGQIIFSTTDNCLQIYDGVDWYCIFSEGEQIPPSAIGGGAFSEVMSFASGGNKHVSSTSPNYESLAHIIYGGSDNVGAITKININAWNDGVGVTDVRVVDLTTGLTIVEKTGITAQGEENIEDMGVVSNLPTTPTAFEIQGRKISGGGSTKLLIASIQSLYG